MLEPQDLGVGAWMPGQPETHTAPASAASATAPAASAGQPAVTQGTPTETPPPITPLPRDLVAHLDEVERDILVQALEKHRLNRTAAGASLGLSLRQMRYRMARLGVQVTDQGVLLGERCEPDADVD